MNDDDWDDPEKPWSDRLDAAIGIVCATALGAFIWMALLGVWQVW